MERKGHGRTDGWMDGRSTDDCDDETTLFFFFSSLLLSFLLPSSISLLRIARALNKKKWVSANCFRRACEAFALVGVCFYFPATFDNGYVGLLRRLRLFAPLLCLGLLAWFGSREKIETKSGFIME